jgi:DNA-binding NarL/FixJ family response regulator
MGNIRIFVCDDHDILRQGLRSLFGTAPGLQWAGEASDGESALAQLPTLLADVILLDLLMPGLSEIELVRQVRQVAPDSKILVLTSSQEEDMVVGSLRAGANGYLLKSGSPEALLQGIRDVAAGMMVLPPQLPRTRSAVLHSQQEGGSCSPHRN